MATRIVATTGSDLVAEERTLRAIGVPASRRLAASRCTVPATVTGVLTLAEQLPEKTHGRFPSHETDPPVGQDRPSILTAADPDIPTTSLAFGQFPSLIGRQARRPPGFSFIGSLR